jgi:hypothetical protein
VYRETPDRRSDRAKYRNEAVHNAGDTADAVDNVYTIVRDGLGVVRPIGQHTETPRGGYSPQNQPSPGSSDPFVGLVAGAAMFAEAARVVRERRKRKKARDGDR